MIDEEEQEAEAREEAAADLERLTGAGESEDETATGSALRVQKQLWDGRLHRRRFACLRQP